MRRMIFIMVALTYKLEVGKVSELFKNIVADTSFEKQGHEKD